MPIHRIIFVLNQQNQVPSNIHSDIALDSIVLASAEEHHADSNMLVMNAQMSPTQLLNAQKTEASIQPLNKTKQNNLVSDTPIFDKQVNNIVLASDSILVNQIDAVHDTKVIFNGNKRKSSNLVSNKIIAEKNTSVTNMDSKQTQFKNSSSKFELKMPTPIKADKLDLYLNGYDSYLRNYLVCGFKKGFRLNSFSWTHSDNNKVLTSATQHPDIVDSKLLKEAKAGRILGPLNCSPFDKFIMSPLGLVPKKVEGQYRVIHHLSYPSGSSVNDGISKEFSSVKYANISQAIKLIISVGKNCYLAKSDIQAAFRIIPISPIDYPLLGFKWKNKYYFDKCLPMGASSSCQIFERFSTSLEWILHNYMPNIKILHVLDDFLFIAPTAEECSSALRIFLRICEEIGVPIAQEKTFGPLHILPFLGIQLDTTAMSSSLPPDKISKFLNIINEFLLLKSVTLHKLQSLTGMLNFACQVIEPGRAFSRRLYDLSIGLSKPYHHVKLTCDVKEDLLVWKSFLENYNGRTFFLDYVWLSNTYLNLYTDAASTIGFGAVFDKRWLVGIWAPQCMRMNITLLELYPIYLAIEIWGKHFENKCLQLNTDNIAVMYILNSFTSKDKTIMIILRKLVLTCIKHNILIRAVHLAGSKNIIPDLISRQQVEKAKSLNPFLMREPDNIPDHLLLHKLLRI